MNRDQMQQGIILAVSGKLGSGKDTIASLVMAEMDSRSITQVSFAGALRCEVNQIIEIISQSQNLSSARVEVANSLLAENVAEVVEARAPATLRHGAALYPLVKDGVVSSSDQRHPSVRLVLQLWGTEVRRTQNPDYWVDLALKKIRAAVENNTNVVITDARYENEIQALQKHGAMILRLDISPEVQAQRILLRDGHPPLLSAISHKSELSLDDWSFPARVNVDRLSVAEVVHESLRVLGKRRILLNF